MMLMMMITPSNPCTVTATDGSLYDLSALVAQGPIVGTGNHAIWTYTVAICQNIIPCNVCVEAGYCQSGIVDGQESINCVGTFDKEQIRGQPGGQGVELVYQEPTYGRIGRVIIRCDEGGPLVSRITALTPDKVTGYEFHFFSSAACSIAPIYPCIATAADGSSYDLSVLRDHGPLSATGDDGLYAYAVSVCRDANPCNDECPEAGYCQHRVQPPLVNFCVGTYVPDKILGQEGGNGVTLFYEEPKLGRIGKIFAECDALGPLVSDITAVSPSTIDGYEFYFKSYAACSEVSPDTCTVTAADGTRYDLTAIRAQGTISQIDNAGLWTYTISVCSNSIPCNNCPSAGYCQTGDSYTYCVGTFRQIIGKPGGAGVELVYWEPEGRLGRVDITCNPGGPLVSEKRVISPTEVTGYEFLFRSSAACAVVN